MDKTDSVLLFHEMWIKYIQVYGYNVAKCEKVQGVLYINGKCPKWLLVFKYSRALILAFFLLFSTSYDWCFNFSAHPTISSNIVTLRQRETALEVQHTEAGLTSAWVPITESYTTPGPKSTLKLN